MSYKVDYHIHSWCSDGTMKPTELVRKYKDEGYDMIAITDHDGIDGVKEAMIAGEALKIKVISGIELATIHGGIELHILGYQFDVDNTQLLEKLAELKSYRQERNQKMLVALRDMGYDLKEDDLKQWQGQTYIGKPNFARALAAKGYVSSPKEAFVQGQFLESDRIKALEREKISSQEAISLIKGAGGIAVLAHPGKVRKLGQIGSQEFWTNFDILLGQLKKAGLGGLECYHPSHREEDCLKFVELAEKYHLHITEGSDYHGEDLA